MGLPVIVVGRLKYQMPEVKPSSVSDDDWQLMAMRAQGLTYKQIGERVGRSSSFAYEHIAWNINRLLSKPGVR